MTDALRQIADAIAQIRSCNFECEGGPLENNVGWRALLSLIRAQQAEIGRLTERCDQARAALRRTHHLINPLHGEIDRQTLDMKLPDDEPDDAERVVVITRKHESDLAAAVLLIEQFDRGNPPEDDDFLLRIGQQQTLRILAEQRLATVLDEAYSHINAIGSPDSAEDPNDQFAKGINHAVDAALKIIGDLRAALAAQPSPAEDGREG